MAPLRAEVLGIADSVRRALGIETAFEPAAEQPWQAPWQPPLAFEDLACAWVARNHAARVTVQTLGYSPDSSGYVGGEQTWTITLFGNEASPRGTIVIQQFQWAGWSYRFDVPPPIVDALRADGVRVEDSK